jgi:putative SOS response-associated peptidase YedK
MCVNYKPASKPTVAELTGADISATPDWPEETWQDYAAPLVRADEGGAPELVVGTYGMIPKRKLEPGVRISTMNARAESIAERRSYAQAWRRAQTCLLPMHWFCEPNYEADGSRAQRWSIGMADGEPFCVAGLWRAWEEAEGGYSFSFTQITVNADHHPLMKRFQKPEDEKRSLVVVPKSQYRAWLNAGSAQAAWSMLDLYPSELMTAWPAQQAYGGARGAKVKLPGKPDRALAKTKSGDAQGAFDF